MRLRLRNDRHLEAVPNPPPAEPPASVPTPIHEAPPGIGSRALRSQLSSADARTERLVRQVRAEIEDLRALLDTTYEARDGLFNIDYDAIVADPGAVAALPPETLTHNLVGAARQVVELKQALVTAESASRAQRTKLDEMRREQAWLRGRYETLTEVIAALHGNVDDLRRSRDSILGLAQDERVAIEPASGPEPE